MLYLVTRRPRLVMEPSYHTTFIPQSISTFRSHLPTSPASPFTPQSSPVMQRPCVPPGAELALARRWTPGNIAHSQSLGSGFSRHLSRSALPIKKWTMWSISVEFDPSHTTSTTYDASLVDAARGRGGAGRKAAGVRRRALQCMGSSNRGGKQAGWVHLRYIPPSPPLPGYRSLSEGCRSTPEERGGGVGDA